MTEKKKIIIIGAGISGMTAGIYALDNGYDVTIYEKHIIPGGQCTGWERKGVFIDGCAHWIVGTSPKSDLFPLWEHVGAFDENTIIHDTEYFTKVDVDGDIITFYADLDKLKNELLRVSPEDKKHINRFIRAIRAYMHVRIPTKKPLDHHNLFEITAYGIKLLPMAYHFARYKHISIEDYAKKFKSEKLRRAFDRIMTDGFNIHSFVYVMQSLVNKNAGVIEGGSKVFAFNIQKRFIELGGKIITNKEVDHILIENDVAKGVVFKDQHVEYCDFVISSADAHHTMYDLLQGKYEDEYFSSRFENRKDSPLSTSVLVSYKVTKDLSDYPKMVNFEINPIEFGPMIISDISIRNHTFDKTLNKEGTTITVLINTIDGVYDYLKPLTKEEYNQEKKRLGNLVKEEIIKYVGLEESEIELLDIATPLTYERYTNAYRGSYMSFVTTDKAKGLMRKGLIKGIKNFVLAGQWVMSPGGLPIALFTGKHAAIRVCKMDKKKFVNLERIKV